MYIRHPSGNLRLTHLPQSPASPSIPCLPISQPCWPSQERSRTQPTMSHPAYYQTSQESYSSHQPYRPGDYVPQVPPALDPSNQPAPLKSSRATANSHSRINSNSRRTAILLSRPPLTVPLSLTNTGRMSQKAIPSLDDPRGTIDAIVAIAEPLTNAMTMTIGK